jgi:hypothetical protein
MTFLWKKKNHTRLHSFELGVCLQEHVLLLFDEIGQKYVVGPSLIIVLMKLKFLSRN